MALGSTQPLTEMSSRNLLGCKKRPAHRADNLASAMSRMSEYVGASTSRNPKGLRGLYRDSYNSFILFASVCFFLFLLLNL
jgi:hypothetical protein